MEMIKSRNQTSHTYNKGIANQIVDKIRLNYYLLFSEFLQTMRKLEQP